MTDLSWLVPALVASFAMLIVVAFSIYALNISVRASRAKLQQSADWWERFHELESANDQVIVELESHPATYSTFPKDVSDAVYAAHDSAREIETERRK